MNTLQTYYGEGYERGDAEYLVRLAAWVEQAIPDGEMWYGHDVTDESIRPFEMRERDALLAYFRRVGHEPYDAKRRRSR